MQTKVIEGADDVASAPESGTNCDETSGNWPSKGGYAADRGADDVRLPPDDPSSAPESGTVRS